MRIKEYILSLKKKKMFVPVLIASAAFIVLLISHASPADNDSGRSSFDTFADKLKREIEELCLSVDGVRSAKVVLTLDTSEERVLAKDSERNGSDLRLDTVISDGKGIELSIVAPKVRGVAVVCTGGDKPSVKKKIVELVSSALGISSSKVSVCGGG